MASHPTLFFTSILLILIAFKTPSADAHTNNNICLPTTQRLTKTKLQNPTVILISFDGFRFGYHLKAPNPNIRSLIADGTEALEGLIPVFPTLTFPNHYAIATGLYPPYHGIINNWFVDPITNKTFTTRSHEPEWWLGEPLWETVVAHGLNAAAYFWAGAEVIKGPWKCPTLFCPKFNMSIPFGERVDTVLGYFDLPTDQIPAFISLYLEDPDSQGHVYGPDDPRITAAIERVDEMIGRLVAGLKKRRIFDDVHVILVGDHGMVGTGESKRIFIEDLSPWIEIPGDWVQSYYPLLAISPPAGVSPANVVEKMNEALGSGEVENGGFLKMYLKEDLPERLVYSESYRIPPVIGMLGEGFMVDLKRTNSCTYSGAHGYDNAVFSMRSIFVGRGPRFAKGRKVPSFKNVEIYNIVTDILGLQGAPNNGTKAFSKTVLVRKQDKGCRRFFFF